MDGTRLQVEIECKLEVPNRFRVPELSGAMPLARRLLTATYYDTADLRLARHRITMRRRTGGNDDGWHLKLPHEDDVTRDELHLALDTPGDPPPAFVALVLGFTRGAPLRPVATLRNDRRPTALVDTAGRPLAELTDDHVSVLVDQKVQSRFREVEVEAAPGRSAADLRPIVAALIRAGAHESNFASKAVRALGPRASAPPDAGEPAKCGPRDPAALALQAHISRQIAVVQLQDLRVRRGFDDSVHQMRVALRRLRSTLKVFAPLFAEGWPDPLRDELGWLADELGAARDAEVLQARLLAGVVSLPKVTDVERQAATTEIIAASSLAAAGGRQRAAAAMNSPRYLALLDTLVQAAQAPSFDARADEPCREVLLALVDHAWRELARDVKGLRRKSADEPWHEARIQAKRVRYAVDAVAPVFGAPAIKFERRLGKVTELLGRHQDAAIAAAEARSIAARSTADGTAGFVLGRLHDATRAEVGHVRREFLDAWPTIADPRRRRWLRGGQSR